jgi:carbonic anhydrase
VTFPYIRERADAGKLTIDGWHYIIEMGEVFVYDQNAGEFRIANGEKNRKASQ